MRLDHDLNDQIRAEESQDEQAERICRYFKTLSDAQETALFLLNPKTELYSFVMPLAYELVSIWVVFWISTGTHANPCLNQLFRRLTSKR